jgi:UrcA family protein
MEGTMSQTIVASFTALVLGIVGVPLAAVAALSSEYVTEEASVTYDDLDIHSVAGARVLYARLRRASREVCDMDSAFSTHQLPDLADAKRCYRETLDNAVATFDSEELRTVHAG